MIPRKMSFEEFGSEIFKNSYEKLDNHIVCFASNGLTLFNALCVEGENRLTREEANEFCRIANHERKVVTCFDGTNHSVSLLPLLDYDIINDCQYNFRNYRQKRAIYTKCIKEIFRINREQIDAPCISLLLEPNEFDNDLALEIFFNYCTSANFKGGKFLEEICYIDTTHLNT